MAFYLYDLDTANDLVAIIDSECDEVVPESDTLHYLVNFLICLFFGLGSFREPSDSCHRPPIVIFHTLITLRTYYV